LCPGDILQAKVEYHEEKKTAVEASIPQRVEWIKKKNFNFHASSLFFISAHLHMSSCFLFYCSLLIFFVISCGFEINVCIKALTWMWILLDKRLFHPHFDWLCVNLNAIWFGYLIKIFAGFSVLKLKFIVNWALNS